MARLKHELGGASAYAYYFTWQTPMLEGLPGAWHTAELQFCFDNTKRCEQGTGNTPEAQVLAKKMASSCHQDSLVTVMDMGVSYRRRGMYPRAEAFLITALHGRRRTLGDEHPLTLTSIGDLGSLYVAECRYAEADPLLRRRQLDLRRRQATTGSVTESTARWA